MAQKTFLFTNTMTTIRNKKFKSFDGTSIGYQVIGQGKKTIILCNGLGGTSSAWSSLYERLDKQYRFITWDYRGLFRSDPPNNPNHLDIAAHAQDLQYLIEKEKLQRVTIAGWSMGVQVALEYCRTNPKILEALILMSGTSGQPFKTAMNLPLSRYILPLINEWAHKVMPALQPTFKPLAQRVMAWEGFLKLMSRLGLVHHHLSPQTFSKVTKDLMSTDLSYYHAILQHLGRHNASDVLASIKIPTLIISGTHDIITPIRVAQDMANQCPRSELFIVPGGTHYTLLEFPKEVSLRISHFLSEHFS